MPGNNQPDTEMLRNSLTREVTNDAYAIASQVFRQADGDLGRVSNEQLDERYRQAFLKNDRGYLMQEAGRDPAQFLAAMQRLGVQMPAGQEIQPDPPLPKDAKSNAPIPKPPAQAVQPTYDTPQEVPPTAPQVSSPAPAGTPPLPMAPVPAPPLAPPMQGGGLTLPPRPMPPPPGVIPPPAQPPY